MSSLTRIFVCILVGFGSGMLAFFFGAVFLPLIFLLSLQTSESARNENHTVSWMFALLLAFGSLGFALCWKLTKKAARE